jgi:hypothetical protein
MESNHKPPSVGSYGHFTGQCHPCNKFIINKPNSCKHDEKCNFCHEAGHNRPKHTGQRGRHVRQKRQYLETRELMAPWICELIDKMYDTIKHILRIIKTELYLLTDYQLQIKYINDEISRIGIITQNKRPDNSRDKKDHYKSPEKLIIADLDDRFKWLAGSCHLMIRKILEADSNDLQQTKLEETINEILEMIEKLPTLINKTPHISQEYHVPQWLSQKLTALYEYPYSTEMYTKKDIDYIETIIRKIVPLIDNDDDDENNYIKNIILDPCIETFGDLSNNFKKYELFIDNCVKHYFSILQ